MAATVPSYGHSMWVGGAAQNDFWEGGGGVETPPPPPPPPRSAPELSKQDPELIHCAGGGYNSGGVMLRALMIA